MFEIKLDHWRTIHRHPSVSEDNGSVPPSLIVTVASRVVLLLNE